MHTYGNIVAGGVEFPVMKMVVEYESLVSPDSGRTDDGVMHIEDLLDGGWIQRRLRKVKITLPPTPANDLGAYLDAVLGKEYVIDFIDPIEGETQMRVYTSAGSVELYNARIHGGLWYNITFNAIEMGEPQK